MKEKMVKYDNKMNEICFRKFSQTDLNAFMKIVIEICEKGVQEIEIDFDEIMIDIDYKGKKSEFVTALLTFCEKVMALRVRDDDGEPMVISLFSRFKPIKSRKVLQICVNKDNEFYFNNLGKAFTSYGFREFISLESKYSKNLFRLLMQWKSKGHCPTEYTDNYFTIIEIKDFLDTPDYEPKRLREFIIEPAIKELNESGLFQNLELVVHKAKKRGSPVMGYSFRFEPVQTKKNLSEKQKKAIEHKEIGDYVPAKELEKQKKSKQNRFNDFPQREYTNEQMSDLEKRLLGRT